MLFGGRVRFTGGKRKERGIRLAEWGSGNGTSRLGNIPSVAKRWAICIPENPGTDVHELDRNIRSIPKSYYDILDICGVNADGVNMQEELRARIFILIATHSIRRILKNIRPLNSSHSCLIPSLYALSRRY